MSKEGALHRLEGAVRDWYWETDTDVPTIGILLIGLSDESVDIQYLGQQLKPQPDWPTFFGMVIQHLERGSYSVNDAARVNFEGQR